MPDIRHYAYADGTRVEVTMPFSLYRKARALCPDGRVRSTVRIAATADTFFSVPAAVQVNHKTVAGFITFQTRAGWETPTDNDPAVVKFFPYKYRKNAHAFDK
jgi:hypothetical protein